jgi:integrase/recombinase XerD
MTPLRQRMIGAMRQRGFSDRTHQSYLYAVTELARYFHRSPDQLSVQDIQAFFVYLVQQKHLAYASCRLHLHALRFLYLQVLHWSAFDVPLVFPKKAEKIPELLTRREVRALITSCDNPKHRMMLLTCYGCGLRVSELVSIKVRHLDGERHLLRVEQGKGSKDRMVALGDALLQQLRSYWRQRRPPLWLFPSNTYPDRPLTVSSIQSAVLNNGPTSTSAAASMRCAMPMPRINWRMAWRCIACSINWGIVT